MPAKTFKILARKKKGMSSKELASSVKKAKDKNGRVITQPVTDKTLKRLS